MKIFYIFFIIIFFFTTKVYSTNVAVIDINFLINNSIHFVEISKKINNSQIEYKDQFKNIEQNLYKKKDELEDLKLILNDDEFNIKKDEYYKEVSEFENDVTNFNKHYENEIINIKNIIFSKISKLIENHALENKIDLILDKNQYLISAEKLNISEKIFLILNESKLDLKFKEYEN